MKRIITPILMSVLSIVTIPTIASQPGDTPLLTKSELHNMDRINDFRECEVHSVEDLDDIYQYAYDHNFDQHKFLQFLGNQMMCEMVAVGAPIYKKKTGGDIITFLEKVTNIPDDEERTEASIDMMVKFQSNGGIQAIVDLVSRCQHQKMCFQYGAGI